MTVTEHICRDRPSFRKGSNPWVKGMLANCPYHGSTAKPQGIVSGIRSSSKPPKRTEPKPPNKA